MYECIPKAFRVMRTIKNIGMDSREISNRTGLSVQTTRRLLSALIENGYVRKTGNNGNSVYKLVYVPI